MKRVLIIAEKPKVARKIASFLFSNYQTKLYRKRVKYYVARIGSTEYIVASALGHLFTLVTSERGIPALSFRWERIDRVERGRWLHGLYIDFFCSLRQKIDEIIVATDYDIEGELIAYNIIRFCLGTDKPIRRMKFSEITPRAIQSAFSNLLEFQPYLSLAGEARHIIDWLFGINLSRLLQQRFHRKRLSAGRVQTPTLRLVYEREREIASFVPEVYYRVVLELGELRLSCEQLSRIKPGELQRYPWLKARRMHVSCNIKVESLGLRRIEPPEPFNLSELQSEAWKIYGLSPAKTLRLAQSLYEKGFISYPRTDSQRYPEHLNFREILSSLGKLSKYSEPVNSILSRWPVKPKEGSKTDPAHPCIYPTGLIPGSKDLTKDEAKVYHLVARRFLATFMEPMLLEQFRISANFRGYKFTKLVYKVLKRGWHEAYPRPLGLDLLQDPRQLQGQRDCVLRLIREKTKPPSRYTPSSLVKTMESLGLGTKSTRAEIVEKLYKRGYIKGKRIKITDLGKQVIEFFLSFYPLITSVDMTRQLEERLNAIESGLLDAKQVIEEAKETLLKLLSKT
jgi:DNA topoisomerase-1